MIWRVCNIRNSLYPPSYTFVLTVKLICAFLDVLGCFLSSFFFFTFVLAFHWELMRAIVCMCVKTGNVCEGGKSHFPDESSDKLW